MERSGTKDEVEVKTGILFGMIADFEKGKDCTAGGDNGACVGWNVSHEDEVDADSVATRAAATPRTL
jgi:hypothetical protein